MSHTRDALKYPNLMLETKDNGRILIVKINRPNHRNAVNPKTASELHEIFTSFNQNSTQKIAILTGHNNTAFCSGYDL
jgi:enoyl-CoA hydratase